MVVALIMMVVRMSSNTTYPDNESFPDGYGIEQGDTTDPTNIWYEYEEEELSDDNN